MPLEALEVWLLGPPKGRLSRSQVHVDMDPLEG